MPRRPAAITAALTLLAVTGLAGGPLARGAKADPARDPAPARDIVRNIQPPGARGNVTIPQLAELGLTNLPGLLADPQDPKGALATASATTPANFADQWELYDGLNTVAPGAIDDAAVDRYFKPETLGVPAADVVSTESPKAGVTITRDTYGVPHIKGETYDDVAFGAGYANIQDRMFLTDILRHTGAARMAEFVGPTPANIAMDVEQLRLAPYTPEEAAAQVKAIADRYPGEGARLVKALDAFVAGMNAAQEALCPGAFQSPTPGGLGAGFGPDCPAEYAALQKPPTPYTPADIIYIASLVGGIFGKGGGGEYANAVWLQQLQRTFGADKGRAIYDDLREKNDPEAPTTSPDPTPLGRGGVDPHRPSVAMPDLGGKTAPGTGSDAGGSTVGVPAATLPGELPAGYGIVDGPFGPIDLGLRSHGMSNALVVDAQHSATGHPVAVFGPQTGYYTPQLLVEQELDGPGVHARGVSFAGTNLVVELGRGVDYAWSATSASDDIVDTVMDRLCNTDGSAPSVDSTAYVDAAGHCTPMDSYVHHETAFPNAAGQAPPQQIDLLVLKTAHGVVQSRTTVGGVPVAVVSQRSTYGHEIDSAVGFARVDDPGYVHDAASFQKAFSAVDYTFNWFYADDHDIAYFNSALFPLRPATVEPDLPRWGDPAYDWTGFLDAGGHPQSVNPSTGFLVSWNNKQAPGWASADNQWGYGAIYRSLTLSDRVRALIAHGGKVTPASLTGAMMDAATVDVRGAYLLPLALDVIGRDGLTGEDAAAYDALKAWTDAGAHRLDADRSGGYEHQPAIALFDTWWEPKAAGAKGSFSLPKDVLRGTLGDLVDALPKGLDDHPRQGIGSAWNGVPWYGYVSKDLRQVLHRPVQGRYSRTYCGGGSLAGCRADLRASLHRAVAATLAAQNVSAVSKLTYDKGIDAIRPVTAGVVGVRPIDWQNRPTFQQVVSFGGGQPGLLPEHPLPRPRPGPALAATGGSAAVPVVGLLLVGLAGVGLAVSGRRPRSDAS